MLTISPELTKIKELFTNVVKCLHMITKALKDLIFTKANIFLNCNANFKSQAGISRQSLFCRI
uniref:Uncharacterized protein n=1 Tax=Lepeophtheirus salmonis TaxID=72036 RepID=A0A0K2UBQ6_LEPSM